LICTIEWKPRPLAAPDRFTAEEQELARQMGVSIPENDEIQPMDSFEDFQYIYSHYPDLLLDYYRTIIRPVRKA
jgi:hypothetical protein